MNKKTIFIKSGELAVAIHGECLSTVLGSCVSVCIIDVEKKIAGMNHYLLPAPASSNQSLPAQSDLLQYGIYSIPALLKEFKKLGSLPVDLEAKIIGGALAVGTENIALARKILKQYGIRISAEEVGGSKGRKVELDSSSGSIRFIKLGVISKVENLNIVEKTNKPSKIKVLIIDDSPPMRKVIRKMIEIDAEIEVVGEAADPFEAELMRKKFKPDVLTLDLNMPKQDGVSYLRQYMPTSPLPAIIVTDYNIKDTHQVMDALESGAFDYIQKPALNQMNEVGEVLLQKIKDAALVDVHRLLQPKQKLVLTQRQKPSLNTPFSSMIAIGSSTGGTEAIKVLLMGLPSEIPPIVIVQHMPPGFTKSFADRLNDLCSFHVKEAQEGDRIQSNCVYIAPGGKQMAVLGNRTDLRISINDDPPENRFKPSVDYLFRSFDGISGKDKIAVILTGMGRDGSAQLLELRNKGVHTIAQDESTSVVFGMPKAAIEIGAVSEIKRIDQIAEAIMSSLRKNAA